MINIFIGFDQREAQVYHVLTQSILDTTTVPVSITPLHVPMLRDFDGQQDGTNRFIYSRFLVPELMNYQGWALYMDSDMLVRGDLVELWDRIDNSKAVMCVKHEYKTKQKRKFIGTPLECDNQSYPRKNWSSLILWNCAHPLNRILSRRFVAEAGGKVLHRFSWLADHQIGEIPPEWNVLVGEQDYREDAKNAHFTLGAPTFFHYRECDYSGEYMDKLRRLNHMEGSQWQR